MHLWYGSRRLTYHKCKTRNLQFAIYILQITQFTFFDLKITYFILSIQQARISKKMSNCVYGYEFEVSSCPV